MSESNPSAAAAELDFWEFVNCAQCHSNFLTDSGAPSVPFWLTECGHVVCNNHLRADRSCAQCGEQGIQMIPLQREMDAPMSDWFRSIPLAFDSIAYAARFQMNTLASLVTHYKNKYTQQRTLLDRLKNEYKSLKKTIEDLRSENDQLRQYVPLDQSGTPGFRNANGKRARLDVHQDRTRTNSSPRSVMTPVGPDRLTLPPDHNQPTYGVSHSSLDPVYPRNAAEVQNDRPGSSRFAQQYAYRPPQTPNASSSETVTLSYAQTAPARQALARQAQRPSPRQPHMPPPPVPRNPRHDIAFTSSGSTAQAQAAAFANIESQHATTGQAHGSFHLPNMQTHRNSSRRFVPATPARANSHTTIHQFSQPQERVIQSQQLFPSAGQLDTNTSGSGVLRRSTALTQDYSNSLSNTLSVAASGKQRNLFGSGS